VEATYCIRNFCRNCNIEQAQILVSKNILDPLLTNLTTNEVKLIEPTIYALSEILKHGEEIKKIYNGLNPYVARILEIGGGTILENLQEHKDMSVYNLVRKLLERYFPIEAME